MTADITVPAGPRSARVWTPEQFGAGTSFADDPTAVQAAINAAQSSSGAAGLVHLSRVYNCPNGGITITSPIAVTGRGGVLKNGGSQISGITSSHATNNGLLISCSGVTLRDFAVVNTASTAPTAGAGIRCETSGGATWGDLTLIDHVDTVGWWDNIQMAAGSYWKITNCYIYNAANHGIKVSNANNPDGGDQFINNNGIVTSRISAGAGIFWESGGGLKIANNKINGAGGASFGFLYGVQILPASSSTSIVMVEGNSIENTRSNSIRMADNGNTLSLIVVQGNQCSVYNPTGTPLGVIDMRCNGNLSEILVANNLLRGSGLISYGLYVDGVNLVNIGQNVVSGPPGGLYLGAANGLVDAIPPTIGGTATIIRDMLARSDSANKSVGRIDHNYSRQVPATAKGATSTLYAVGLAQNDSCVVTVTLNGAITGLADYVIHAKRLLTRSTSGACTVTTVGTDVTGGTGVADVTLTFDTAAVSGEVAVKATLASGSTGTNLYGRCQIRIEGGPNFVKRGAATAP